MKGRDESSGVAPLSAVPDAEEIARCSGGRWTPSPGQRSAAVPTTPSGREVRIIDATPVIDATPEAGSDRTATPGPTRCEHDSLGSREVPELAYYGIHTSRALANFAISGIALRTYPEFVNALAAVKQAAAGANRELGLLDDERAAAIEAACAEIRDGQLHDQFVVDVIQGGAGTSTNMNANEVIANRALEILGARRGDYDRLHPLEHVNRSQSTNDVYPTAIKVALQVHIATLHATMLGGVRRLPDQGRTSSAAC